MRKISLLAVIASVLFICGCSKDIKDNENNSINIVTSILSENMAKSPDLDEDGKGYFVKGDIFSLMVSNSEKNYVVKDFNVGNSDLKWKDVDLTSNAGKVNFSACYPKQNIENGKFIFDIESSSYKDLLLSQVKDIDAYSINPVHLQFRHAMHKLVVNYTLEEEMDITTQCEALSTCQVDMFDNTVTVREDKKTVSAQSGKNIFFLIVPQKTVDVTLNITYGDRAKSYSLNELIKDYEQLEGGKKIELTLNVKNGDIQIENPTIDDWGDQGSVDGSIIM